MDSGRTCNTSGFQTWVIPIANGAFQIEEAWLKISADTSSYWTIWTSISRYELVSATTATIFGSSMNMMQKSKISHHLGGIFKISVISVTALRLIFWRIGQNRGKSRENGGGGIHIICLQKKNWENTEIVTRKGENKKGGWGREAPVCLLPHHRAPPPPLTSPQPSLSQFSSYSSSPPLLSLSQLLRQMAQMANP